MVPAMLPFIETPAMHTLSSHSFTRLLRGMASVATLVLGLALPAWGALTVNADGTVSDSTTSLVWDHCAYGLSDASCATGTGQLATWAQALNVAVAANTAAYKGFDDWRLPSIKELESITLIGNAVWGSPAIDATAFPNVPLSGDALGAGAAWTSTTVAWDPTKAWAIDFWYSGVNLVAKTGANYVRLVRGGQTGAALDGLTLLTAQAITFDNPGALNMGTTHTLSATASSGLAPTFASTTTAVCTITSDDVLTPVTAGTCTITADQVGNATFDAAPQVVQSFTIEKNFQNGLMVSASADTVSVGGSVTLSTTGGSGTGAVTYEPDTANCTVSGNTLTGVAVGDCIIIATKAGDALFVYNVRKFGIAVVVTPPPPPRPPPTPTAPTISPLAVPPSCGLATWPGILNLGTDLGPAFTADMVTLLSAAVGQPLAFVEQGVCGTVTLSGYNGGKLAFIPLKFQSGDTRANGIYRVTSPLANGQYQVVRNGDSILLAPALVHVEQLVALLPGLLARQADNGVLTGILNGVTYVVQPGVQVQLDAATGNARLVMGADGNWHFIDTLGNHQVLYPAFADPAALRNALLGLDFGATSAIQLDGTAAIVFHGQRYTLVPDPTLAGVPTERVGQSAWQEGAARYRVVNNQPLGTAQGLTVKP